MRTRPAWSLAALAIALIALPFPTTATPAPICTAPRGGPSLGGSPWKCVQGAGDAWVPVKVTAGGDGACMSFDSGKECVWTDKECCAGYAASADETTPYFECGERYAAAYGGDDGYGEPSSFCNKAFDALGSSSVTAQDAGSPPGLDCERQCLISRIEQANICIRTHSRKFCEREGDRLYQECISKCPLTTGAPPTDAPPTDTASPSDDTQDPCRVCRDLATCKEGEGIDLAKCDKSTGTVHDVCVATAKARYGNCVVGCVAQCGSLLLPEENCLGKYVLVLA